MSTLVVGANSSCLFMMKHLLISIELKRKTYKRKKRCSILPFASFSLVLYRNWFESILSIIKICSDCLPTMNWSSPLQINYHLCVFVSCLCLLISCLIKVLHVHLRHILVSFSLSMWLDIVSVHGASPVSCFLIWRNGCSLIYKHSHYFMFIKKQSVAT